MKKFFATASLVLAMSSAVLAESHVSYRDGTSGTKPGEPRSNQVYFGNNVYVPSKDVCIGNDGNLKTPITNQYVTVCDSSYIDHSDSTHPVVVCTASHRETIAAQSKSAPMQYVAELCTQVEYRPNQNGYYMPVCVGFTQTAVTQNLNYTVTIYDPWDSGHSNGRTENRKITDCLAVDR